MKPDTDIDTEKYSSHNIHNNMFIKGFSDPENMKISLKMALPGARVKFSNYTFPPTKCKFPPLNCTFPPSK
jgi:hypothetical protein